MSELYKFLSEYYGDIEINNYENYIKSMIIAFIEDNKLEDKIYINNEVLNYVIRDTLIDLKRMRDYHIPNGHNIGIERISTYFASFIVKRKPLIPACDEIKYVFLNESFAKYLVLGPIFDQVKYCEEIEYDIKEYILKFEHHLKYRNTNPQTIELAIRTLKIGTFSLIPT